MKKHHGKSGSQAVSFRIDAEKLGTLERLAEATDRPRSWHIEQALDAYLDLQAWQVAEIERGIKDVEDGAVITHKDVRAKFTLRGKRQ